MQRHTVCTQRHPMKTKRDAIMFSQMLYKGIYVHVYEYVYTNTYIYVCTHMYIMYIVGTGKVVLSAKHFPWKNSGLNLIPGTQIIKKPVLKDR